MQVLGIFAGHNPAGVTAMMLKQVLGQIKAPNTVKIINLDDYQLKIDDHPAANPQLDQLEPFFLQSDVWVFATPTYWGTISGSLKNLFDCLRQRLVRFDHQGGMHPDRFKNKHYFSLTCCYTAGWENFLSGVTDATFRLIDKVMAAAGVIKLGELVVTSTWGLKSLPVNKQQELAAAGKKINQTKRKDDLTMKRYGELFLIVAGVVLLTMLLQQAVVTFWQPTFWLRYGSFVVIFYLILAGTLHFATVVKHRRR